MMNSMTLIAGAYLLGSIPFGFLIARAHGVNLRAVGSGNIGATNVSRALGKKWAYVCFLLDVLKGLTPMLLARLLGVVSEQPNTQELLIWILVGCAAVCGHIFPIYLNFKGGKGVATSLGIVLGLWPYFTLCGIAAFLIWTAALWLWRYVSLASMIAAISFPVIFATLTAVFDDWRFSQLWPLLIIATVMAILVVLRHHENIKRLLNGSEQKIGRKI